MKEEEENNMRVMYEDMVKQFERILSKHGFDPGSAADAASIFAGNSMAGVYSHGLNRFPRVVSYQIGRAHV